tara:strand:- start:559 stop:681 length:123 start_codon:yes stop_codon:yes gene_type:complete
VVEVVQLEVVLPLLMEEVVEVLEVIENHLELLLEVIQFLL